MFIDVKKKNDINRLPMTKSVFTPAYRCFLDELIAARKSRRLTQVQLALLLKKPQSYISKYESGDRRLDFIEVLDILRALNIDPLDFMRHLA